jgi:hypothetical protein
MATVVTTKGKDILGARLIGASPTQAEPKFVGWGTQNGLALTAAATDVALFAEATEARSTGTPTQVQTTTPNDTYQLVATITAAGAGKTINEVAVTDSTTKPTQGAVAAAGVVGSAVSTTLNTASAFSPGNGNYVQIRTEVMQVTAGSGSTALTVVRGANGSSAIASIAVADVVTPGNIPGTSATTGGSLLIHADHGANVLSIGDSIQYTIKLQYT